jgi:23S rRNA pseudouridine2605 synthase
MKQKKSPAGRPERRSEVHDEESLAPNLVRLNKYLADNGIASRRKADELIVEGEVMVDGEIITKLGTKVNPLEQRVEVDGVVMKPEGERHRYFLLDKPSGVVCTNDRREARPRAVDLITDRRKGRIYTVGRLDEDSSGLVILTNDGDLAFRLSHPRYRVAKTYRVVVRGRVTNEDVEKLRQGVRLSDYRSKFSKVRVQRASPRSSTLLLTLEEGRNREIRRVFVRLKLPVQSLRRVRVGNLTDRGLKVGSWRPLTRAEVEGLKELCAANGAAKGAAKGAGGRKTSRPGRKKRSTRGAHRRPEGQR